MIETTTENQQENVNQHEANMQFMLTRSVLCIVCLCGLVGFHTFLLPSLVLLSITSLALLDIVFMWTFMAVEPKLNIKWDSNNCD